MAQWEGRSKGSVLGHKIFVFVLNRFGLSPAYFLLRFVAFYYYLFSPARKDIFNYFHLILKYPARQAKRMVYRNFVVFGQTILDKVALMAGVRTNFTIDHEGGIHLDEIARTGKGGILVSAHVGNWEIAGQLLNRLETRFNILMYENEHESIRRYMDEVQKKKNVRIIAIRDNDMSHLIELHSAFTNNELVVMHGDRFREGAPTRTEKFLGQDAEFPAGPFILAARFGVPLSIVFSIKETRSHYHFFATAPVIPVRSRGARQIEEESDRLMKLYVAELETIVRRYPEQWFNYYDFWKLSS